MSHEQQQPIGRRMTMNMRKISAVAAAFIALTAWPYLFTGVSEAYAQETSARNLILTKTYIKTGHPPSLTTTPVPAVTQTIVRCPGPGTCTIRVEVAAQFSSIIPPNVAAVVVLIDGSQTGVEPFATVGFDSTSTSGASNVRTFSWMKQGLTPGTHSIDVLMYVTGGTAESASCTVTFEVYKP